MPLNLAITSAVTPPLFPLFPNFQGEIPPEDAVAATIDAAALGLGIPILHADGQRKFGGHAMRVAGAQSLSRAGFDSWTIGLLARWGSAVVLGYIRDAPLGTLTLLSRRAIPHLGASPLPVVPTTNHHGTRQPPPGPDPHRIAALEARVAALEADKWGRQRRDSL